MPLDWEMLNSSINNCRGCALYAGCTRKVPGQGNPQAPLMLIGEGPGEVEDREGLAFVGPAGQLLTQMLRAIGLAREQVFICNIVKCRPPHNRQPLPEEAQACKNFLRAQVALVRPRVILLLGATAARNTLGDAIRITRDRGQWFERKGVWMMPTYHPSALLRDPAKKREAWEDLKTLRAKLNELGLYQEEIA
ncbi:MAG: uracil-DNA glycosylase [Clostridia bacterium]|nr:uracil-DNA glycosylase [Clostridia bacterium]